MANGIQAFNPNFLPTARGFDYFLGYLTGKTFYWSKRQQSYSKFKDLTYANTDSYFGCNGCIVDRASMTDKKYRGQYIHAANGCNVDRALMTDNAMEDECCHKNAYLKNYSPNPPPCLQTERKIENKLLKTFQRLLKVILKRIEL